MINRAGYGLPQPIGIEPGRQSTLEEQQLLVRSGKAAQDRRQPAPEEVSLIAHSGDLAKTRRPANSQQSRLARARHMAVSSRMAELEEKLKLAAEAALASQSKVRLPLEPIQYQSNQQLTNSTLDSNRSRQSNQSQKSRHSTTNPSGRPLGVRFSDKEATFIADEFKSTRVRNNSFGQAINEVAPPSTTPKRKRLVSLGQQIEDIATKFNSAPVGKSSSGPANNEVVLPSTSYKRKRLTSLGQQVEGIAAKLNSKRGLESSAAQVFLDAASTSTRAPRKRLASSGLESENGKKRMTDTISGLISNLTPQRATRSSQAVLHRRTSKPKTKAITAAATGTTGSAKQLMSNAISSLTNVVEIADGIRADKQALTQNAIVDAMRNNDWATVNKMMHEPGSPLRGLPLGAKNIVLLAHKFPEDAKAPWFQHALTLARGPEWSAEKPKECDKAFNPGEAIRLSIEAQKAGQNVSPDDLIESFNNAMAKARELLDYLTLHRDADFS